MIKEENQWLCKKLDVTVDKKLKIKALALGVPSSDVAFTISKGMMLAQSEIPGQEKRLKRIIKEWHGQADSLDKVHLVITSNVPSKYRDAKRHSCVMSFEVSVLLNDVVKKQRSPWPKEFISDLCELRELLT